MEETGDILPPFKPLISKIKDRLSDFDGTNLQHGLAGVKWCIDNDLIQQGYTLLQEVIISALCEVEKKDEKDCDERKFMADALKCLKCRNMSCVDGNGILHMITGSFWKA